MDYFKGYLETTTKQNCKNEQCFKSHVIYAKWSYSYNDRMFIIG